MQKTVNEEIKELEQQVFDLHCHITAETHIPTRKKLSAEKAELKTRLSHLRTKKEQMENKEFTEKLEHLIRENRKLIFFAVRNTRISIPKNLTVELVFYPCGHTQKLYLPHLIKKHNLPVRSLFEEWTNLLKSNEIRSCNRVECPQCRKEHPSTLKGKSLIAEPLGRIGWTLRRLQ